MRLRTSRDSTLPIVLVLGLLATSCATIENLVGGGDDASAAGASEEPELLTAAQCQELVLANDRAQPLERVAVEGWSLQPPTTLAGAGPAPVAGLHLDGVDPDAEGLEFRDAGDADSGEPPNLGWVPLHELGPAVALDVPVHPLGDPEGGEVEVVFGQLDDDGRFHWCDDRRPLTIEPLPEVDPASTIAAWLDRSRDDLAAVLEQDGTSLGELQQLSTDEVTDEVVPLFLAAQLLRDDAVPAMVAELDAQERELVDRLFTRADELLDVEDASDGFAGSEDVRITAAAAVPGAPGVTTGYLDGDLEVATTGVSDRDPTVAADAEAPTVGSPVAPSGTPQLQLASGGDGEVCASVDTPDLESLLGQQFSGNALTAGGPEALTDFTMFVGGLPVIGGVAGPAGFAAWLAKAVGEYLNHMRPSQLDRSQLLVNTGELYEDDEDRGRVQGVEMGFSSDGWDAGPIVTELAMMAGGQAATRQLQQYLRQRRTLNPRPGERGTIEIEGDTFWHDFEALEAAHGATDVIAEILTWIGGGLLADGVDATDADEGWAVHAPRCWELDAPVDEVDGLEAAYLGAIEEGGQEWRFQPFDLGDGVIEAELNLAVGENVLGFVSQEVQDMEVTFGLRRSVEVLPLQVRWTPDITRAEPGDTVAFDLEVHNAQDGRVEVSDDLDALADVGTVDASGGTSVGYPVPEDWDEAAPIQLQATSRSETGLRDPGHPNHRGPVSGSAWILPDGFPALFIRPSTSCLQPADTWRFAAEDQPLFGDAVEVVWEAERGSIDGEGNYTAPDDPGADTVTATSVEDDALTAETTFTVGSCDQCGYEVRIDGLLEDQGIVSWIDERLDDRGIHLEGVDWETGSFDRIRIGDRVKMEVADGSSGALPGALDVYHLHDDVVMYEYNPRRWGDDPRSRHYASMLAGEAGLHRVPVENWSPPPPVTAQVGVSGAPVDADEPSLEYEVRIEGPLLVGLVVDDTADEGGEFAFADTATAEQIEGSITVTVEGVFRPGFNARPSRPGDDEQGMVIDWDLDGGHAWCGGPYAHQLEQYEHIAP